MESERLREIAAADSSTVSPDSRAGSASQSVWRTDWQWVALAWLGGIMIGGIFLILAFSLKSNAGDNWLTINSAFWGMIGGGTFLIICPGSYATWEIWRGHRKSTGQG